VYADQHSALVETPPDRAWQVVSRLGGVEDFYAPRALWQVRCGLDRLVGGPGYRIEGPGRPLEPGDRMDFWEVEAVRAPARLRVRARTRLPGTAHLDVLVRPRSAGSELTLRTEFEPAGVAGHAYWWSSLAAHSAAFALMTRRLADLVTSAA
jgi:hypothetical protein